MPRLRVRWALIAGGVLVLAALAALAARQWGEPSDAARQVVYAIPPGTADQIARGEQVQVLPQTITLTLGRADILIIRNDDTQPVTIGPFRVAPGQQFRQRYYSRGTYDLICSVHAGARLRVLVQ